MNRSYIEWIFNPDGSRPGQTSNPLTGCLNGCEYCYARRLANGRLRPHYLANKQIATPYHHDDQATASANPFYPRWWNDELEKIAAVKKPKGVFLCDMSDWLGDWVPILWQKEIMDYVKHCSWHRFYLLTKQYHNLLRFSPYPSNVYLGATATDKVTFIDASNALSHVGIFGSGKKYISVEPLLKWQEGLCKIDGDWLKDREIDWIIIGGCTGSHGQLAPLMKDYPDLKLMQWVWGANARWVLEPKVEWVEELVAAADEAGIKVFLKDSLKPYLDTVPTRIVYQYGSAKLRQEVP
jgi:protein gp37